MAATYTAPPNEAPPQSARAAARERTCRLAFRWIGAIVALGLASHFAVLLWARHEFTVVEAIVALHSSMLANGWGFYFDLNHYPFTVSPYGPVFYAVSGYLHKWGLPPYLGGRMLSFSALLVALWLSWRALGYLTRNAYARVSSAILAASTANLLFWGTVGQVDMLAACLSLAGFTVFLEYRERRQVRALVFSGVLVILAVLTKQTALAAGAAIGLSLLMEERKRAAWWIAGTAAAGATVLWTLNIVTHGRYYDDAFVANIVPFHMSLYKLRQHAEYLVLTGSGVLVVACAGLWRMSRRVAPLYLYAGLVAGVWILTAPKIGSDLNYQLELMLALCMCAGCALDQLAFFGSLFSARRTWVTLLQVPLLLHVVLNVTLTARTVVERAVLEPFKRRETEALKPFIDRPGRILSAQFDSLVYYRGRMDVEPYIYSLLVQVGRTDPTPLLRDILEKRLPTVILLEDIFRRSTPVEDPEVLHMPAAQIEALRQKYYIASHIEGPYGVYVYEPRRD
jgi:hypothetical protein